jgi:hypothetical protein
LIWENAGRISSPLPLNAASKLIVAGSVYSFASQVSFPFLRSKEWGGGWESTSDIVLLDLIYETRMSVRRAGE